MAVKNAFLLALGLAAALPGARCRSGLPRQDRQNHGAFCGEIQSAGIQVD
jgi:hypothetical protein